MLYEELFEIINPGGMMIISDQMTSGEPFYDDPQFNLWIEEVRNVLAQMKKKNMLNLYKDRLFERLH